MPHYNAEVMKNYYMHIKPGICNCFVLLCSHEKEEDDFV